MRASTLFAVCCFLALGCSNNDEPAPPAAPLPMGVYIVSPPADTVLVGHVSGFWMGNWLVDPMVVCSVSVFANLPDSMIQARVDVGMSQGSYVTVGRRFTIPLIAADRFESKYYDPPGLPEEPLEFRYRVFCGDYTGLYHSEERRFFVSLQ